MVSDPCQAVSLSSPAPLLRDSFAGPIPHRHLNDDPTCMLAALLARLCEDALSVLFVSLALETTARSSYAEYPANRRWSRESRQINSERHQLRAARGWEPCCWRHQWQWRWWWAPCIDSPNLLRTEAGSLKESRHFPLGVIGNMWMDGQGICEVGLSPQPS